MALQSSNVRAVCASALLQFLLDYPMSSARRRRHLTFLAANLAFEHDTGRAAALAFLQVRPY